MTYGQAWPYLAPWSYLPPTENGSRVVYQEGDSSSVIADYVNEGEGDKPCTHARMFTRRNGTPASVTVTSCPSGPTRLKVFDYTTNELLDDSLFPFGLQSVPSFTGPIENWVVPDYSVVALRTMWPEVEAKLSSINSILELKDFKSLLPLYRRTMKTGVKLGLFGTRFRKKMKLKDIVRLSGEHVLNWSFAVRPFLSDYCAIFRALQETKKQVYLFLDNQGKPLRRHYSKSIDVTEFGVESGMLGMFGIGGSGYRSGLREIAVPTPPKYCATLSYSYRIPNILRETALARGMLDAFGVNLNPAILWNAVPWSFAVDWIFKVGDLLDACKTRALEPVVIVHSFVHSVKMSLREKIYYDLYREFRPNQWPPPVYDARVEDGESKNSWAKERTLTYYVRKVATPNLYMSVQSSGISKYEGLLASALLVTRK